MYLVVYCFFCLSIAFIMAAIFQKKFEESVITIQIGIIVALYAFYVLDILNTGFWIMCLLFMASLAYSVYNVFKFKRLRESLKLVFRPSTLIYFALLIFIYFTVRENTVKLIDELHLWAALPKILFYQGGKFQLRLSMVMGYQAYIPGIPLWLYFLERINGTFSEPLLYFGYAALGAGMLIPACGKISSLRKWYVFPIITFSLYVLPLIFYNTLSNDLAIYYKSIFVDPILGLAVGYGTWLLVQKPWANLFNMIKFSLCCSLVILIKSSGIVFVGIWLVSLFIYLFIHEKQTIRKWYIYAGTIAPLIIWLIWKICLNIFSTKDMFNYTVADIFNLSFIKYFLGALFSQSVLSSKVKGLSAYCTPLFIMLWLVILSITWWTIVKKRLVENGRLERWAFVTLIIQIIVFTMGLYGLCVGPLFNSNLLSFGRYICTVLTAFSIFIFMSFLYEFESLVVSVKSLKKINKKYLFGFLMLEIFCVWLCHPPYLPVNWEADTGIKDGNTIHKICNNYPVEENEYGFVKAVLLVDNQYTLWWPLHRRLYFDLIENDILCNGVYFEEDIINETDSDTGKMLTLSEGKGWDGYTYVYRIHGADNDPSRTVETYKAIKTEGRDIYVVQIEEQNLE